MLWWMLRQNSQLRDRLLSKNKYYELSDTAILEHIGAPHATSVEYFTITEAEPYNTGNKTVGVPHLFFMYVKWPLLLTWFNFNPSMDM